MDITAFNTSTAYNVGSRCLYDYSICTCVNEHIGDWVESDFERLSYTTTDKVWLMSESEVYGYPDKGEGAAYKDYEENHTFDGEEPNYYYDVNRIVLGKNGPIYYWLRSARNSNRSEVYSIHSDGYIGKDDAYHPDPNCAPAFCVHINNH